MSNVDIAFDKNGKYYELLKTSLKDQLGGSNYYPFFQKNTTNLVETIQWLIYLSSYDEAIDYGLHHKYNYPKSSNERYDGDYCFINIFILNYDEQ